MITKKITLAELKSVIKQIIKEEFEGLVGYDESDNVTVSDSSLEQAKEENPEFVDANPEIENVSASDIADFIAEHGLNFDELANETEGMSAEEIANYLEGSAVSEGINVVKAVILSLAILLASCAGGKSSVYQRGHSKHGMSKDQKWQQRHRNIGGLPCGNSGGSSRPTQ